MLTTKNYFEALCEENKDKEKYINLEDFKNTLKLLDVMGYDETFLKITDVDISNELKDINTSDSITLKISYVIVKDNKEQDKVFEITSSLKVSEISGENNLQNIFVSIDSINVIINELFEKTKKYKYFLITAIETSNLDNYQFTGLYDEEHKHNEISKLNVMETVDGNCLTRYIFGNNDYEINNSDIYKIFELDKSVLPEHNVKEFIKDVKQATLGLGIKSPQELMKSIRISDKNTMIINPSKRLEDTESIEVNLP